jgi:hypothetical protein
MKTSLLSVSVKTLGAIKVTVSWDVASAIWKIATNISKEPLPLFSGWKRKPSG